MLDAKVKAWLMDFPGLFVAKGPGEVIRKAWAACGIACSTDEFTDALWRAGFRPEQIGNRWQLALPAKQMEIPNNVHALRHVTSRGRG